MGILRRRASPFLTLHTCSQGKRLRFLDAPILYTRGETFRRTPSGSGCRSKGSRLLSGSVSEAFVFGTFARPRKRIPRIPIQRMKR
jgi:hypothetical protein